MEHPTFISLLEKAVEARESLFDAEHQSAFRLFNGFSEGDPDLVIDLYASTLLFHNYADDVERGMALIDEAQNFLLGQLSWLHAGILKMRNGKTQGEKRGKLLFGEEPDRRIQEHGGWYAIDLTMNRDASFYLDTRNLRRWLINNMQGRTVLNTFA